MGHWRIVNKFAAPRQVNGKPAAYALHTSRVTSTYKYFFEKERAGSRLLICIYTLELLQ